MQLQYLLQKGYKWIFPGANSLFIDRGDGMLNNYDFGSLTMSHAFYPVCGTGVLGRRHGVSKDMDVDIFALEVMKYDGKGIYRQLPLRRVHTRSRMAQRLFCQRARLVRPRLQHLHVQRKYPPPSQASIISPETLSQYSFGRRFQTHDFCSTCGVAVHLIKLDIGEAR
ncbi:hypothetical protein BJ878DRAFT_152755 [Calycina marina]|uniref:Uncharacterized protein n=1 Tax=Calycina marina TaxID=1763456 RepID=A0A9P7Z9X3_9HELO|nr:hypothetical protein BJ878DRAFT_152755 [Calycina marina]